MTLLATFQPGGGTTGTFAGLNQALVVGTPPNQPPGNFPWVVVYNYSAYLLEVNIGSSQNWLEPSTANAFPAPPSGSNVSLVPVSVPNSTIFNAGTVQATWYAAPDGAPQGFPLTLPSSSPIAAQAAILVGTITALPADSTVAAPGALGLMLIATNRCTNLEVQGVTSGAIYGEGFQLVPGIPTYLPYNSVLDPQVAVSGTITGGTLSVYALYANPDALVAMGQIQSPASITSAPPAWAMLIGGLYEDKAQGFLPMQVDANGRQIPIVPTSSAIITATGTIIAAPASGANYLFGADLGFENVSAAEITANGAPIALLSQGAVAGDADHADLNGFRATTAVTVAIWLGTGTLVIRYAPGP